MAPPPIHDQTKSSKRSQNQGISANCPKKYFYDKIIQGKEGAWCNLYPCMKIYESARFVGRKVMAERMRQPHSTLAISSARSRHILNSIPTVIYELAITAKGFPTRWVSDSVTRILGYEVEEALAPDWWIDCLHPDDKEAALKNTSILMTQGHLVQEYRFRSKDGHYLWIQDEASVLWEADGRSKEIVGFWTNITERKQVEEQAARASGREVAIGEDDLTRLNNRIALRVVIGALIVSPGFLLLANKGPLMWGMTIIGLSVFALGSILGLIVVSLMLNSNKRSR